MAPCDSRAIADRGRVYFASDDGCLYCVDAALGTLRWRFRGGPCERKILGNERLISTWPARGGSVLFHRTIYFTVGIWPFMGIFVHAVDAETGRAVWTNSGEGSVYMAQPHGSPAFGGFAPCGYLAATVQGLIVPGGRTQPACYDLGTGRQRYFDFGITASARQGKPGTYWVTAHDQWFMQNGRLCDIGDGKCLLATAGDVFDQQALYGIDHQEILAQALQPVKASPKTLPATGAKSSAAGTGTGKETKKG